MKSIYWGVILSMVSIMMITCHQKPKSSDPDITKISWDEILAQAKGEKIYLMMWQGDAMINQYMSQYVVPALKTKYNIDLILSPGQGNEIVKILLAEKEQQVARSAFDICWINGETFYQLRQIDALYGPFVQSLPNSKKINFDDAFIALDFQQAVNGYECPWGNVQMTMIYDSLRTPQPPKNLEALSQYVKQHPGKFTIPYEFTGITLLKSWMVAFAGDKDALNGPFDEEKYKKWSTQVWKFINEHKQYFWREGHAFPESLSSMHQMFANGTIDFTMSNNDAEVDNKIFQNIFPSSSRSFVFDFGTIRNSHFLGIAKQSTHKAAAMVAINFLISEEAQLKKMNASTWGDGTILDIEALSPDWQFQFKHQHGRKYALDRTDLRQKAVQEPDPRYMIRLYEDFRTFVIN